MLPPRTRYAWCALDNALRATARPTRSSARRHEAPPIDTPADSDRSASVKAYVSVYGMRLHWEL